MPDMEKTIKELTDIGSWIAGRVGFEMARNFLHTIDDAVALLKQQESVEPTWSRGKPFCGVCGLRIHGGKFCSECGRPIAWEGR